ncbi:MraY family glycosyltransferase [Vagococcus lutrae]|nr:MraY family glycosyltransferase [Vagococcus lutrae]MCO7150856.1 undecaprenyl/decaprenyl-phosphate alpha-N-acetylglucosaminyl 1-phosphate transferase [Vagococcus lutrae]MDT2811569.1 MraY family glycosyltransferase [Vagococcus lutrae]MDT2819688.1 MraY family glycosyltransferase [Vagococcus lutrae]MDT2844500.1 MraY family glycosyltransferase [Vagococcus lutrae]WCG04754.1 MraY family glycosyltransferase [Vagococcus lutrae]
MSFTMNLFLKLLLTVTMAVILTPIIRRLAFAINAVDLPNERRINKIPMPSAGGLAIYISFSLSLLLLFSDIIDLTASLRLIAVSGIVVLTGLLDDIFELTPRQKMFGTLVAAFSAYFFAGIKFETINIGSLIELNLGWFSLPITIFWIVGFTNAINLIDGLDGLASGVSAIALTTIGIIGYIAVSSGGVLIQVPIMIFVLVASIIGFLPYNFFPAKIYLGDTGALFLGFMIAILSLQGLKNATFISLITPLIILGVPITDTFYAIIRRTLNKQSISNADHMHLHHRLISLGFTHRGAVLMIYALSFIFSFAAILYSFTNIVANIFMVLSLLLAIELFVEQIGLVGENRQPLLNVLKFIGNKAYRKKVLEEHKKK